MRGEPYLFDVISNDFGISKDQLRNELEDRSQILEWLKERGVTGFEQVSKIISEYYKDKESIMKMVNSENPEYSLEDVIDAEQKVNISRPEDLDNSMADENVDTNELDEAMDLNPDASIEEKLENDVNPVAEIEKKLRSETEIVEKTSDRSEDDREKNPFEKSQETTDNPFEA
jgi:hypothetical protein